MSLRTWWLENRLSRIDQKLKRLRSMQKRLRDEEAELAKERKKGLDAVTADAREAKLNAERERVTQDIARVMEDEEHVKRELRDAGVSLAAH